MKLGSAVKLGPALAARLFGVVCFVSTAIPAFAAEHGVHHQPSSADLIPYWINFALYLAFLFFVLRKPVPAAWRARAKNIESMATKGAREIESAKTRLEKARGSMRSLSSDMESLATQIRNEGEEESREIVRDAKERASRIAAQGKDLMEGERRSLEGALKREMIGLVMKKAEELVSKDHSVDKDGALRSAAGNQAGMIVH